MANMWTDGKMGDVPEHWQRKARTVFNVLDCNKKGTVSKDDMSALGRKWGNFYKEADVATKDAVVAALEKLWAVMSPKDVPYNWKEFVLCLYSMWSLTPEVVDAMDDVMNCIYDFMDTNKNGSVSLEEFQNWWHANNWDNLTVCETFFPMMDPDKKGWVTKKRFCSMGRAYFDVLDQIEGTFSNFWWGPLWTEFEMPEFWVRKVRTVFQTLDVKKCGSLNSDSMEAVADHWCQLYRVTGDNRTKVVDVMWQWWRVLNPDNATWGWEDFVRCLWNMWSIRTLSSEFISASQAMWSVIFDFIADLSGYLSWGEFQNWWRVNGWNSMIECEKVFKWMDRDNKGLVSRKMFFEAARWYFETTDEFDGMANNLWWGPLWKKADMPDYWVRKMKTVFKCLDVDRTGVLMKSSMSVVAKKWCSSNQHSERDIQRTISTFEKWMAKLNPDDNPMTRQDFVDVMWVKVHEQDRSFWGVFGMVWEKMFDLMETDKSRKMSREEFIQWCDMNGWDWEELETTVNFLEDHGWLTKQQFCDACRWYFNVLEKVEGDDWNMMWGPLVEADIPYYWKWKVKTFFSVLDVDNTGVLNRESMKALVDKWCTAFNITGSRVEDILQTFERWMIAINPSNASLKPNDFVKVVWEFIHDRQNLTLAHVKGTFEPVWQCLFDMLDGNASGKIMSREFVSFWKANNWKDVELCKSVWKWMDEEDRMWLDRKQWCTTAWLYFEIIDQVIGTDFNMWWGPMDSC